MAADSNLHQLAIDIVNRLDEMREDDETGGDQIGFVQATIWNFLYGYPNGRHRVAPYVSDVPPACVIGQRCERHDFIHGWEAEHLRQEMERYADKRELGWMRRILDEVDARDSLAYIEAIRKEDETQPKEVSRTLATRFNR